MFCTKCGKEFDGNFCPYCGQKAPSPRIAQEPNHSRPSDEASFQLGKLVISIISLALSFLILFQSCTVGLVNTLDPTGDMGGTAGLIVVICWWVSGIIGCAARKSKKASIAAGVSYALAAWIAYVNTSLFQDLEVYAILSVIFAGVFIYSSKIWE